MVVSEAILIFSILWLYYVTIFYFMYADSIKEYNAFGLLLMLQS
jgi:hypothetical protein